MQNDISIPEERFKQYEQEYEEKFNNFENLKTIITKQYVYPQVSNPYYWNLNYDTCEVTVQEKEDIDNA